MLVPATFYQLGLTLDLPHSRDIIIELSQLISLNVQEFPSGFSALKRGLGQLLLTRAFTTYSLETNSWINTYDNKVHGCAVLINVRY